MSDELFDSAATQQVSGDIREQPQPEPTRFRYVLYALGVVMIFIGLKGIIHNTHHYENPAYWARLFIGGALVHDLVIAPVVIVVSVVLSRLIRAPYRAPVQLALFVSAVFGFVAYPGVRRFSDSRDNTSVDPLNYAHGLLISLGVVWGMALIFIAYRFVSRRRAR
jgi:hypothetical protein